MLVITLHPSCLPNLDFPASVGPNCHSQEAAGRWARLQAPFLPDLPEACTGTRWEEREDYRVCIPGHLWGWTPRPLLTATSVFFLLGTFCHLHHGRHKISREDFTSFNTQCRNSLESHLFALPLCRPQIPPGRRPKFRHGEAEKHRWLTGHCTLHNTPKLAKSQVTGTEGGGGSLLSSLVFSHVSTYRHDT